MKLLALDLSTTSTGYAVYVGGKLEHHGFVLPSVPGLHKLKYPMAALERIRSLTESITLLITQHNPDEIVIEEVNRSTSRISQKSLDALHFFVLDKMDSVFKRKVNYMDSNGKTGWRPTLKLGLSDADKFFNKEARKMGKKTYAKLKIDWKVLAQRWVNAKFNFTFDVKANDCDSDVCDAIALGYAYLLKKGLTS